MREGIGIAAFTIRGRALAERLGTALGASVREPEEDLQVWTERAFASSEALIFIGAAGIAVRAVAPFVKNKAEDPAVVVLDAYGRYVIPLLSGHLGGANALAKRIASLTGGTPVLTTETDATGIFAVDLWAKAQGLAVLQVERIKTVSSALLAGGKVTLECPWPITGEIPQGICLGPDGDVVVDVYVRSGSALQLVPKTLFLGVGCRKGVSAAHLAEAFSSFCEERGIAPASIAAAASIDCKREEAGLLAFCEEHALPLSFFSAAELGAVQGVFTASPFVQQTVGVDNVCERSAVLLSSGTLLEKKYAKGGVSFALAMKTPVLNWNWEATWENSA